MEADLKILKVIAVVASVLMISVVPAEGHSIVRRNAFQMCNLINQYTGESCLKYNPYGCFCGYDQRGTKPIDTADMCCKKHDDCYGRLTCYFWNPLFVGYEYRCESQHHCTCANLPGTCSRSICDCDLELAECLRSATFNPAFRNYDRRQCIY